MKQLLSVTMMVLMALYGRSQMTLPINDLNIPTSPAFVLLDKSPASIEKPSSPKALAVSLVNVWEKSGAVEFTPYWFRDRPAYTFRDNLQNRAPVFQTFAISAATAKVDTVTGLSIGFRTQFFKSYSKALSGDILAKAKEIIDLLSVENPEDIDMAAVNNAKKELNYLQTKTTFIAELAGAYKGESSPSRSLAAAKAGIWLHLRYTPDKFPLTFVGLARYTWGAGAVAHSGRDTAFFDYGINLSYQNEDFDIQAEYVNRRDFSERANYDRLAIVVNYQVIPGIVAVASLGKDFKRVNNVFALLGVKFGISREVAKLN